LGDEAAQAEAASNHNAFATSRGKGPERGEVIPMAGKYEAYCVKCKAKREFEGEETTLKNGRRAAKGTCPVCGTTVMRILGKA
jgi:NAD-dependent SIR2 family protein deacetylase